MTGSKDRIDISPINIMKPTLENLSAEDQHQFEDYVRQRCEETLQQEAQ
jgi:hypothetical protein